MRIRNTTRDTDLAGHARRAASYWSRLIGLLGRSGLQQGEALVLEPCSSVHTAFMRFTIDVVYVDKAGKVVKLAPSLKPFRVSAALRGGHAVIELPKGTLAATGTAPGDQLTFEG